MAMVVEALLSASVQTLIDKIASSEFKDFFKSRKLNVSLLDELRTTLLALSVVLNDAEEKEITNHLVKKWLEELEDAIMDAEDLLAEINYDSLQSKLEAESQTTTSQVWQFLSSPFNQFHRKMNSKMEEMCLRLKTFADRKDILGLQSVSGRVFQRIPSTSLIVESIMVGRMEDKKKLKTMLLSDGHVNTYNIGVVAILGMGGVGKTTLAQLLYNDEEVQQYFNLKAWACVSEDFDVISLTKTLLESVTSRVYRKNDLNFLRVELRQSLKEKKFLFVLDDLWNDNYNVWDDLQIPLTSGKEGSKIIITTRQRRVAEVSHTFPIYRLQPLSDGDCLSLLSTHAFGRKYFRSPNPDLIKIGRKLVKRCGGLPIAAKTLGGLLRSKEDANEWNEILESDLWDLPSNDVLPALHLSYLYLPANLKGCFAYCSLFPKGYEFKKEELILLWMAEGLIPQPNSHKKIEEVGDSYFCELVSRSFFQEARDNKSIFVMHHLVNDLAKFISGSLSVRLEGNNCNEVEERTRHLSFIISHCSPHVNLKDTVISKANHLRTILQIRLAGTFMKSLSGMPSELLLEFRYLRVLSLVGGYLSRLPDSIGELKHLRYLNLSNTKIVCLPVSICNLHNLQTLKLVECYYLTELPTDIHRLINLRHLDIRGTHLRQMPMHMNKLINLHKLTDFFIGEDDFGSKIGELGEICDLHGSLSIHHIKHVADIKDCEKAKLMEKDCLEKLYLDWGMGGDTDNSHHDKKVLDSLRPHQNLIELGIYNYPGTEFPNWLGESFLCNVVSLRIEGCKYCYKLPPLGQLSSLKDLRIIKFAEIVSAGSEFYGRRNSAAVNFPALEILWFEDMSAWEKWCLDSENEGQRAFPHLREIHIECCPRLTGGLPGNLPSLTLLKIRDCKELRCSLLTIQSMCRLIMKNCGGLELPEQLNPSLTSLYLHHSCDMLKLLSLDLFPNLKSVDILGCKNLEAITNSTSESELFSPNVSLRSLCISDCPRLVSLQGFKAPRLTWLSISNCEQFKHLPTPVHWYMPTLKDLHLSGCPEIESMPEFAWPHGLRSVCILNCQKFISHNLEWGCSDLISLNDMAKFKRPATLVCPSTNFSPFVCHRQYASSAHHQRK